MNSDKVTVTGEDGKKGDKVAKSETASPVSIDDRIKKLCNLPEAHFDFDSAAIGGTARTVLDALAKCFVDGAGKGKSMNLVGHTDLRGPDDYNMGLGQKRAAAVAGYLQGKGLESGRLATSSRGEIEASGSDPSGMAKDRRVEILLAE